MLIFIVIGSNLPPFFFSSGVETCEASGFPQTSLITCVACSISSPGFGSPTIKGVSEQD